MKSIGERLKKLREHLGLRLEDFYSRVQIPDSSGELRTISKSLGSRYESGEVTPRIETLIALWRTYGVNLHWLLTGEGRMFVEHPGKSRFDKKTVEKALQILGLKDRIAFFPDAAHVVMAVHYTFALLADRAVIDRKPEDLQELINRLLGNKDFLQAYSAYNYYHPVEAAIRSVHELGMEEEVLDIATELKVKNQYGIITYPIALCVEVPLRDPKADQGPYTALSFCRSADTSFIIEFEESRERTLELLKKNRIDDEILRDAKNMVLRKYLDIVLPEMKILAGRVVAKYSTKEEIFTAEAPRRKLPPFRFKIPLEARE